MSEASNIDPHKALAAAVQKIALLESEMIAQQEGALLYIAAIVERAVGVGVTMTLTEAEMIGACSLILERGDTADGGMAVRVIQGVRESTSAAQYHPTPDASAQPAIITELAPVLAKAYQPIILLDTARPQGE